VINKILIPIFTIGIFTNSFYYLTKIRLIPLPEYIIYFSLFLLMISIYLLKKQILSIDRNFIIWYIIYLSINLIYIALNGFDNKEINYLVPIIMILPIFIAYSLLYSFDDYNLLQTRKSIVLAMIIAVPLLVFDFILPGHFIDTKLIDGRAVATFANANIVGSIFALSLIFTIDIINKNFKSIYVLYLFIGILVTFSRSNIILFLILLFILTIQKKLSKTPFISIIILIMMTMTYLIIDNNNILNSIGITLNENTINRLLFFIDHDKTDLGNISERERVLTAALNMFFNSPFFGNGFASTRIWEYPVGPHNTIALTFADFGLLALTMVPLLLFVATYKIFKDGNKKTKDLAKTFIFYYLYSCMFSHNMLEQPFNYIAIILLLFLGKKSIRNQYETKI
jgi:hypothetical protein